jgi:DNA processing protein
LPSLAIVGGRNCSSQGASNAHEFSKHLAANGLSIISGLALGIDTQAHSGALAGQGATIAVMATGIDQLYPAANRTLANDIIQNNGCVITEFPLGTKPMRGNFPKRNRIISGLSLGTLVVEAKLKSGSLITANTAIKQNREVFAIPGSIHNPMAKGCHQLIKTGAKLIESSQDIIDELQGALSTKYEELKKLQRENSNPSNQQQNTETDNPILNAIEFEKITVDELAEKTQQPIEQLQAELLMLELEGIISHVDGVIERKF